MLTYLQSFNMRGLKLEKSFEKEKIVYTTSSGNLYPLEVGLSSLEVRLIPHNKADGTKRCSECSVYGRSGACPPYSDDFACLQHHFTNMAVLYIKLNTCDYPSKSLHGKHYVRWNFTETFMPQLLAKLVVSLSNHLSGLPLGSGRCKSCRTCHTQKENGPCIHPHRRLQSLEAVGVNVSELMASLASIPLQWWDRQNNNYIPEYQVRVGGILHNQSACSIRLLEYPSNIIR